LRKRHTTGQKKKLWSKPTSLATFSRKRTTKEPKRKSKEEEKRDGDVGGSVLISA